MIKTEFINVGSTYKMKGVSPIFPKDSYSGKILKEYARFYLVKLKSFYNDSRPYDICVLKNDIDNGTVIVE